MKKYLLFMMFIFIFALVGCGISKDSAKESEESIVEDLTDQMVRMGIMSSDMQTDDGKSLAWEDKKEIEIEDTRCYAFELRYSDEEDINGEMSGRLIGSYAVSKDGMKLYQYNLADDAWEQILPDEAGQ